MPSSRQTSATSAPESGVTGLRDHALRLARLVDRPVVRAYALFGSAQLAVLQRGPDDARHYAAEAIVLCRRYGFRLWLALCEVYAGWAAAQQGELDLAPVRAAIERIDAIGNRMLRTVVLGLYTELQLLAGDRTGAVASLATARHEAADTGEEIFTKRLAELERRLK